MLKGINHIGIAVKSLEEAKKAYGEGLGGEVEHEVHRSGDMSALMVSIGGTKLEFMEPAGDGGVIGKFLESRGEGVHHICIEVDDISKVMKDLADKGFRLIDKEPRQGIEGKVAFLHPKSMNGVLVELVEVAKR
jgi:lactoylglutathione lyase/methylmalonyl-CoA/ethylmalonyl-CoA epimerase